MNEFEQGEDQTPQDTMIGNFGNLAVLPKKLAMNLVADLVIVLAIKDGTDPGVIANKLLKAAPVGESWEKIREPIQREWPLMKYGEVGQKAHMTMVQIQDVLEDEYDG